MDGNVLAEGEYNSDYENGMSPDEWKAELEKGEAVMRALEQIH